jgi:hypothetical protein
MGANHAWELPSVKLFFMPDGTLKPTHCSNATGSINSFLCIRYVTILFSINELCTKKTQYQVHVLKSSSGTVVINVAHVLNSVRIIWHRVT